MLSSLTRIRDKLRQALSLDLAPYWVAAAITALVSVLYATIYRWSENFSFDWTEKHPHWVWFVIPLGLLGSAWLAQRFAPYASGSGIPQLMASIEIPASEEATIKRLMGGLVLPIKIVASCLCIACGGIVGREGPMLQIAATIFRFVHQLWPKLHLPKRAPSVHSMILAGGAAGLASAFNTPLGGVVFAIEELGKVHISLIRTTVFHSVIIAGLISQAVLGDYLYLGKLTLDTVAWRQVLVLVPAALLIGAAGATAGAIMARAMDWRSRMARESRVLMTLGCGVLVACLFYVHGRSAIGSGREVIVEILTHPEAPLPWTLAIVRPLGNLFSYAGGVVGGVFAPALASGAAMGAVLAHLASQFADSLDSRLWALAGMVAFLTGLTRTPFTSLILVLEMTDSHSVILPLMTSAVLAQGAARLVSPAGFYEIMAQRILRGLGFEPGPGHGVQENASPTST